jgi:hypothetical protein
VDDERMAGFQRLVTGQWPPYSFADSALGFTEASRT